MSDSAVPTISNFEIEALSPVTKILLQSSSVELIFVSNHNLQLPQGSFHHEEHNNNTNEKETVVATRIGEQIILLLASIFSMAPLK